MITELREVGDSLALYTEDNLIRQKLKSWKQLLYEVPYTQGKHLIAVDLYFPKTAKRALTRAIKNITGGQLELAGVPDNEHEGTVNQVSGI